MQQTDTEQERKRLAELYANMADEELQGLASDSASLTAVARETLKAEISRRGLRLVPDAPPPSAAELRLRELVTVATFVDMSEALMAQGRLESEGIETLLGNSNMSRL
jgi:hypothetical protein